MLSVHSKTSANRSDMLRWVVAVGQPGGLLLGGPDRVTANGSLPCTVQRKRENGGRREKQGHGG